MRYGVAIALIVLLLTGGCARIGGSVVEVAPGTEPRMEVTADHRI